MMTKVVSYVILVGVFLTACEDAPSPQPQEPVAQPSAVSSSVEPMWPEPLPEECKPWRAPKVHVLSRDEVLALPPIKGEPHSDRVDCWSSKEVSCDFWSISNAFAYADKHLFPMTPDGYRATYGGGVDCSEPRTADNVHCTVEIKDPTWPNNTVGEVDIDCTSTHRCQSKSEDCCKILRRRAVFKKAVVPTEANMQQLYQDMANNRIKQYQRCLSWCEKPQFANLCATGWDNGKVDLARKQKGLSPRSP